MKWALCVLAAACSGDETTTFAPIIDVPAATSAAYPWTDLDSVTLLVTHAVTSSVIAQLSFARGDTPQIPGLPFGDDILVHLSGTRGALEVAYGRTCPVTVGPGVEPDVRHLYFARIVRWAAGPMPAAMARTGGAAYTAPDGSAVFVGGDGGETRLERFDTDLGAFSTLGASVAPRDGAVLAPLADGSALRIGGTAGGNAVGFFELLLATQTEPVQHVDEPRLRLVGHTAATLVDGTVVVAGGTAQPDGIGPFTVTGATWIFALGDAGGPAPPRLLPATLATPRSRHTMTRLGDDVGAAVLVVGGRDAAGAQVATAEIYEPLREAYDTFHPAMVRPRFDHRAVRLPDGSVLVIGGRDADTGGLVDSIEIYRPLLGQFATAASLPANAGLTDMSVTPLADGRVLLAGGNDATGHPVATTLIAQVDPINGMVILSPTDAMAAPRARHEATLLCDGTVLLVGGTTDAAAPASERYNPPAAGRR